MRQWLWWPIHCCCAARVSCAGFDQVIDTEPFQSIATSSISEADATRLTDAALEWLGNERVGPWLMYLHSLDLHLSYRPRPPFDALLVRPNLEGVDHARDLYDNELAANDAQIGRLIEALRQRKVLDDTVVVVTADHGEEFGEHGTLRHGHSLFDPAIHVPLIMRLPRARHGGQRRAEVVSQVDLMPTLLGLAQAGRTEGPDGEDLARVLAGQGADGRPRSSPSS